MLDTLKLLFKYFILDNIVRILSVVVPSFKNHPYLAGKLSPKAATVMAKTESTIVKTRSVRRVLFIILSILVMNAALVYISIGTKVIWYQAKFMAIGMEDKQSLYDWLLMTAELENLKKTVAQVPDGKMDHGTVLDRISGLKKMAANLLKLQEQWEQREQHVQQQELRLMMRAIERRPFNPQLLEMKPHEQEQEMQRMMREEALLSQTESLPKTEHADSAELKKMIAELEDLEKVILTSDGEMTPATGLASNSMLKTIGSLVFGYDYSNRIMGSQAFGMLMIFVALLLCTPAFGFMPGLSTIVKAGRIRCACLVTLAWTALIVTTAFTRFSTFTLYSVLLLAATVAITFATLKNLYNKGKKQMEIEKKMLKQIGNVVEQMKDGKSIDEIDFKGKGGKAIWML